MKKLSALAIILAAVLCALSACRYAVVETGSVLIEAPTPTPEATPRPTDAP